MSGYTVDTSTLKEVAALADNLSSAIGQVAATLTGVAATANSTGHAATAAALTSFCTEWGNELARDAAGFTHYAETLVVSAASYERTEQAAVGTAGSN